MTLMCIAWVMLAVQATFARAFTVCVVPDPPWTICTLNNTNRMSFSGHDVEMFRFMAAHVGWRETVDYDKGVAGTVASGDWSFRCSKLLWSDVLNFMSNSTTGEGPDTASCAIAMGDIISQAKRYNLGVQFAAPYYHTGLAIMVATAPPAPFDKWGFLKPFNWTLWLALGATLLVMPSIVWFVEYMALNGHIPLTQQSAFDIKKATYECIMACFNIGVYQVTTAPAQIIIIVFLFLMLIIISSYTANLAAVFTNAGGSIVTIHGWQDLVDRPVYTPATYVDALHTRYGLNNMIGGHGGNLDQLLAGKRGLLNGTFAAYVTNIESLQGFLGASGYNTDCSVRLLMPDVMEPAFNFAFAFHKLFPRELVNTNVSNAVMLAEESGLSYFLHEKYLHYQDSCTEKVESEEVSFNQLSGLWILLGGALGIALIYTVIHVIVLARRHMKEIEQEELSSHPSAGLETAPSVGVDSKTKLMQKAMTRVFVTQSATMARFASPDGDGMPLDNSSSNDHSPAGSRRTSPGFADSRRTSHNSANGFASLYSSSRYTTTAPPSSSFATATTAAAIAASALPPPPRGPPSRLGSGGRMGSMPRSGSFSISEDYPVVRVDEDKEEV